MLDCQWKLAQIGAEIMTQNSLNLPVGTGLSWKQSNNQLYVISQIKFGIRIIVATTTASVKHGQQLENFVRVIDN